MQKHKEQQILPSVFITKETRMKKNNHSQDHICNYGKFLKAILAL